MPEETLHRTMAEVDSSMGDNSGPIDTTAPELPDEEAGNPDEEAGNDDNAEPTDEPTDDDDDDE